MVVRKLKAKPDRPKVLGMTSGIGSMLLGARQSGFNVVGNIEWRRYYHVIDERGRNTFTENFPGAGFWKSIEGMSDTEVESLVGVDLIMGHPECGNFSNMTCTVKGWREKKLDAADIPLFVDTVARLRPRFFVMDDLPKSLAAAFPMEEYARRLRDYDLFPEWISNYHYGNPQKFRKRMFMIGALRSEQFTFSPGEDHLEPTVRGAIRGLTPASPNHDQHTLTHLVGKTSHLIKRDGPRMTWKQFRDFLKDKPIGWTVEYIADDGEVKKQIGRRIIPLDGPSPVLDGGNFFIHPIRRLPITLRERLRIQGAPDNFILYGTKTYEEGRWSHERNLAMIKQTGKFMPVQFCRYVSRQILSHIKGRKFKSTGLRLIPHNPQVDEAKRWYCLNVGYSDQQSACRACWMNDRCTIITGG